MLTVVLPRVFVAYSAIVVCPWGDQGAAASDKDGKVRCVCERERESLCVRDLY